MTSLYIKLAQATMEMDKRGLSPESHVRSCVHEAVRKRHYANVDPTESLDNEGKARFWEIMNFLISNNKT